MDKISSETLQEQIDRLEREKAALMSALKGRNEDAMAIKLLVAAGHVREDTVEKARELARGI